MRHAQREAGGSDPAPTAASHARAKLLARMLRDAALSAVYVTASQRSRQTGGPSATAAGLATTLYDAGDTTALVDAIRAMPPGRAVLVVAHSNTADNIRAALGAGSIGELPEIAFDRMFVISRIWCSTQLLRLRYGAETPL